MSGLVVSVIAALGLVCLMLVVIVFINESELSKQKAANKELIEKYNNLLEKNADLKTKAEISLLKQDKVAQVLHMIWKRWVYVFQLEDKYRDIIKKSYDELPLEHKKHFTSLAAYVCGAIKFDWVEVDKNA